MLSLVSVEKRFGKLRALSGITASFGRNETVGLIGPNGSGKSTLVNVVTAMYGPDGGQVLYQGADITNDEPHRVSRMGIARTFQNLRLFPRMSVLGNVEAAQYGMPGNGLLPRSCPRIGNVARNQRQKAEYALTQVGLQDVRDRLASSLPLPQLRRLEIARILARDPELVYSWMNRQEE